MTNTASTELSTRQTILALLEELPPDSLPMVETFIRFMQAQQTAVGEKPTHFQQPPWRYPTVRVPAASLDNLLGLLDEGYEGDALADTEAIYEVNSC